MEIRQLRDEDIAAMGAASDLFSDLAEHEELVRRAMREATACVAMLDGLAMGYALLEHSFFGRGFITMLTVQSAYRRQGVGTALVRYMETLCRTERIFTSTNQSNRPMQLLLQNLGYRHSGTVDDLDPGDPELFYSRRLG